MDDKNLHSQNLERRHITVLECDLVGSTALSHRLDPEELSDLLSSYQSTVLDCVFELGGYFSQFAGDAVWIYFGYPEAREDDAARAIQAALEITRTVSTIRMHGESLNVRVGIASGLCIVGNLHRNSSASLYQGGEYITAIGDPPNLAARLQSLAETGCVAVSDQTRSLVGNLYRFKDLGRHILKGFSEEVQAWGVIGADEQPSRYHALRRNTPAQLFGRSNELDTIHGLWNETIKGNGQVLYVTGDPGIGKSHLAFNTVEEIKKGPYLHWSLHCHPTFQASAFAPLIRLLRSIDGVETCASPDRNTLKHVFPFLGYDNSCLLAELLSTGPLPGPGNHMSASRRRERLYEILIELVEQTARLQPLYLIVEDIQWVDPSTQAFLHKLIFRSAQLPIMMLITCRHIDDAEKSLTELYHVHHFHLEQLQREDCFRMVEALWQGDSLPDELVEEIVDRTDGVPLFLEDVIVWLGRSATDPASFYREQGVTIPANLSDYLMSRIDSLGEVKTVAQVAAAVGREFSCSIISELTGWSTSELDSGISTLVDIGIVQEIDQAPEQSYRFKHMLIRDAAYNSLLIAQRKELHGNIAAILLSTAAVRQTMPETIAFHYNQAGDFETAIKFWLEAAERAKAHSNYKEASRHLENALTTLSKIDCSGARDRAELDIRIMLAAASAGASGISADASGEQYHLALQLCREQGYPDDIFPLLSGAGSFHFLRAEYESAKTLAEECFELARGRENPIGTVIGLRLLGSVQFITGEFEESISSLHYVLDYYDRDPELHHRFAHASAMDHKTAALNYLALSNLATGNTDLAVKLSEQSVSHSRNIDLHSLNYALCYQAGLHYFLEAPAEILHDLASNSFELATKESYQSWIGTSQLLMGAADIRLGNVEQGVTNIEQGCDAHKEVLAQSFLPFAHSVLALACVATGDRQRALKILIKSETLTVQTRQFWYLPEIRRLRAEILLKMGRRDEALVTFQKARESARSLGALFWLQKTNDSMSASGL